MISYFISGLMEEIRLTVQMFQPLNLPAAFGLARLQETNVQSKQKVLVKVQQPKFYQKITCKVLLYLDTATFSGPNE